MSVERFAWTVVFWLSALSAWAQQYSEVAYDDCGTPGKQPHLVLGENYTMPSQLGGSLAERTCTFGNKVVYAFDKMDIQAKYRMEITFLADAERVVRLIADGNPLCEDLVLPKGKVLKKEIDLPRHSFAYGQFVLVMTVSKGANALVSEIRMLSTQARPLPAVSAEEREALKSVRTYKVNTNVDVEKVLPQYIPIPVSVNNVYNNRLSLNGVWRFSPQESGSGWSAIQVPGQWSMQGFKVDSAAFARYERDFEIPEDWSGKNVILRFDGVHSEYHVSVNGREVGYHMGGMTPYEVDITSALREGKNTLALKVRSESEADMLGSLTQYAAHQLGGITRKVTLFAVPEVYVTDLRIVTDLDEDYRDAMLRIYASVTNRSPREAKQLALNVTLDGHPAAGTLRLPDLAAGGSWSGWLEMEVAAPELWNNEHPYLYTLHADLCQKDVSLAQMEKRIGFREIEVAGNRLLVNGVPVKLRGVCRHEAHPLYGRSLTDAEWKADAMLYRAANCNFIRTSHYPPAEEFLEYCDELGLFVEVEAPVCWVGHHANENWRKLNYKDKKYYDYILQADMETVHFYRNHPSVIFWSMANESYWNEHFAQVAEYMKKADVTRPFAFHDQAYGGFNNQGSTAPIANIHYPGPGGYKTAAKSERPMTYGEYCHLNVYNRSELVTDPGIRSDWALALAPMWENMLKTPGVLGGSIWSGIDDIFQLPDGNAVGYGAWGPIDGWRRPKPEYWDMKKIYSPVKLLTDSLQPAENLTLKVENRYLFTNLEDLRISWQFGEESGICALNVEPGKTGELQIHVRRPEAANLLALKFEDPRGFTADEYLIPVGEQVQNQLPEPVKERTRLKKTRTHYLITGENFRCAISRSTGQLEKVEKGGEQVMTGGPWLMVLPLTGGGCYPNHNAHTPIFNDCCKNWKSTSVSAEKKGDDVYIRVEGAYDNFAGEYTLCINACGELNVSYEFKALADVNPRQWGLVFETAEGYDRLFWRRDGLWSVYPADHISRPVGTAWSFYKEVPEVQHPRVKPLWSWSKDFNELGSNDFRATRRNMWYAGLQDSCKQARITVRSNGQQHWRCWKSGRHTRFLVADFVTAGDEMFLSGHYAPYRKPVKAGDVVKGTVRINL